MSENYENWRVCQDCYYEARFKVSCHSDTRKCPKLGCALEGYFGNFVYKRASWTWSLPHTLITCSLSKKARALSLSWLLGEREGEKGEEKGEVEGEVEEEAWE